jgi:hypothetical protein
MRQFFKVISGDTFYMGKEGKESEAGSSYLGSVLVASVGGTKRRTLGGERVRVVLFKIGTDGNFSAAVKIAPWQPVPFLRGRGHRSDSRAAPRRSLGLDLLSRITG